jgi:hypothetical protein
MALQTYLLDRQECSGVHKVTEMSCILSTHSTNIEATAFWNNPILSIQFQSHDDLHPIGNLPPNSSLGYRDSH